MARYALGSIYYYYRQKYELATLQIDRAIEINPNDYHNICAKAWIMTFSGNLAEGVACSIEAMRINPLASDGCLMVVGMAEYLAGRCDAALKAVGDMREAGSQSDAGRSRWPLRAARSCQGKGSRRNSAPSASSVSK